MMLQTFFIDVSEIRRYPSIKPEFVTSSAIIYAALGCLIVLLFGTSPDFASSSQGCFSSSVPPFPKKKYSKQLDFGPWKKFSQKKKKQSSKPKSFMEYHVH